MIVRTIAFSLGKGKSFSRYLILGDDIVIGDREVALKYLEVIRSIGIKISDLKSIIPSEKKGMEFASKLISTDGDVSPLPSGLIIEGSLTRKFQFLDYLALHPSRRSTERLTSETLFKNLFGSR